MDFFTKNERVRSYSIYEHDTTLKIAFGATFFLADFNTGPPIEETTRHCLVGPDDDNDNGDGSWGGVLLVMGS